MESPGLVVILLGLGLLFQSAFAFPFAARNNNGVQGSRKASRSCDCESVEIWLRRNTTSSSELIPSFEELALNRQSFPGNGEKLGKHLRLRPRKNCDLLLKKADADIHGVSSIRGRNTHGGSVEVWLKDDLHCLSMWMECQERLICVGLDVDSTDFIQLTKRKLLTIAKSGDDKEVTGFQTYSLVFTGLLLCAMVILVALCGLSRRKPKSEVYSGDEDVKVVKSEKVKSVRQKDYSESEDVDVVKHENQEDLAKKVDKVDDVVIDRNCNNRSSKTAADPDLGAVDICDKNPNENEGDTMDGQACGKEPQRDMQNKEKEKGNLKSKRKDKDMRSKRAHTAPEAKGGTSRISRFSLKVHSSAENQKQKHDHKKNKKKNASETESTSEPSSPITPLTINPFANRNRRSFIDRELPQRPTEVPQVVSTVDDNYAEPFDSINKRVTSENIDEYANYEPVSASDEIRRSNRDSSSTAATQQWISITNNQDEEILYDSVDEQNAMQSTSNNFSNNQNRIFDDSDTYESVGDSMNRKAPNVETFEETFYEVVDKRNTLDLYEDPNLTRKRSASDLASTSSTFRESGARRTKSVVRGAMAATTPPPLPPLENLPRQVSRDNDKELIEPYTLTRISGDFIVQETSTNTSQLPNALSGRLPQATIAASKEELETMYAKVDKNKQKRDRLESQVEKDERKEEGEVADTGKEADTADRLSPNDCVDEEEDDYEHIPTMREELPKHSVKDGEDAQHDKMVMV